MAVITIGLLEGRQRASDWDEHEIISLVEAWKFDSYYAVQLYVLY